MSSRGSGATVVISSWGLPRLFHRLAMTGVGVFCEMLSSGFEYYFHCVCPAYVSVWVFLLSLSLSGYGYGVRERVFLLGTMGVFS